VDLGSKVKKMTAAPTRSDEVAAADSDHTGASSRDSADHDLARAAAAGDSDAFETLFNRHGTRVARIGSRFFRSAAQVEDIVQESFVRAFLALDGFRPERASFATWLTRIAVNLCYDELRRRQRQPDLPFEQAPSDPAERPFADRLSSSSPSPESQLIQRDLAAQLLGSLSPKDRVILIMLEVEGWTVAEIAAALGWTKTRVKVRAHRARNALRDLARRSE
jgi:RNA polymerase sigma-70 factor (ECF subfamily)